MISTIEQLAYNEELHHWQTMPEDLCQLTVAVHAMQLKINDIELVRRVFDLGNPSVVIEKSRAYLRIAQNSVEIMTLLTQNYLLKG